ncbi:hypothetical protein [Actinomadura violacea]|uniref:Uncharacterized protein n=1 Tax=Actinomadura violacea TaxID=2819934 RepID=A0ABS3S572_9ACTN|nr:hypothetical protein [Actinomadura violacea]MBO2464141.1 hypothetical protein [Actinomadura violacea]
MLGWRSAPDVAAPFESNYLSGTAIAVRPDLYPTGSAGNLLGYELLIVRDVLAECGGVVRWGGDDPKQPKEGPFPDRRAPRRQGPAAGRQEVPRLVRGARRRPGTMIGLWRAAIDLEHRQRH